MDTFNFDLDTDSTLTNDTASTTSDLDWAAFPSPSSTSINVNPFTNNCFRQQDDAVAPNNRPAHDEGVYYDIERFFNSLNQQEQPSETSVRQKQKLDLDYSSSSRSQCYHKLPEHAVKLMQEWYNAHLDDPYPRSPDKKRFITEGNITAQQCRSWFANRRQRLKHVKRNQPKTLPFHSQPRSSLDEQQLKAPEQCYYCQQAPPPPPPPVTTTVNVVINNQTVEQLIQNSLRKFLYAPEM